MYLNLGSSGVPSKVLSSLSAVDYVTISDDFHASKVIQILKPNYYVKGPDYAKKEGDVAGNLKRELNDFKSAIELYKKALSIDDKQFLIHHNLSLSYLGIGEFDLAKKHCLLSLKNNPGHYLSHKMLSSLTKYKKEDEHFKLMKEELKKEKLNDTQKIALNFALSKAYEDLEDFEKSYIHMKNGNNKKYIFIFIFFLAF